MAQGDRTQRNKRRIKDEMYGQVKAGGRKKGKLLFSSKDILGCK